MKKQLEGWRIKILSAREEEKPLRKRIQAPAPAILPIGVGAYSAAVLEYEMKGWGRSQIATHTSEYSGTRNIGIPLTEYFPFRAVTPVWHRIFARYLAE
ncbi:MAG TPA: hypothetical protein VJX28_02590 [Chthoniobacterales bacterium]|nr:hypothetical protein [Chthoniobacterales bacterium]